MNGIRIINDRQLKLPKYVKDAFVRNLRNNKYTQHKGWFSNGLPNCYCVLGVLGRTLEEIVPACEVEFVTSGEIDNSPVETSIIGRGTYLTDFDGWTIWRENGVLYKIPALSNLNDEGFTFSQLADIIEYFY